jgi:malonyl-CoA reductase/3-hydroxypropionate dehydrogenase (NADP+)
MPTDEQIGLSTVFHLADDIASGETFHPSGGLKFDRSVTEGELLLRPDREALARLEPASAWCSSAMRCARSCPPSRWASSVRRILAHRADAAQEAQEEILHSLQPKASIDVDVRVIGDDARGSARRPAAEPGRLRRGGQRTLRPSALQPAGGGGRGSWERVLSHEDFAKLVDDQLTHHFRVARRAALVPNCQIVLLTPDTSFVSSREEFALALFVKNSLHAFTVTLGVESERLPTVPAVNQVQLTRRARTEEPANEQELEEEMERCWYRHRARRRAATRCCSVARRGRRRRGHRHRARRQHVRWSREPLLPPGADLPRQR